jgi:hypothetical protein
VVASRRGHVVGVSNVFATADPDRLWQEIPTHFPDLPLVGYERDGSLAAARRAGFVRVGPLRVWLAD